MNTNRNLLLLGLGFALCSAALAADWSATTVGMRVGNRFSEPGIPADIHKTILGVTHINGDRLGTNLFLMEALKSGRNDPASPVVPSSQAPATTGTGAQELFGFYQRSLSINALRGAREPIGPFTDVSLIGRLDYSSKNTRFAPGLRAWRLGVSGAMPVQAGMWSVGLNLYGERNHNGYADLAPPGAIKENVRYRVVPTLSTVWAVPVAGVATFGGFGEIIAPRGKNGFGNETRTEFLLRMSLLFDIGGPKSGLKAGVGWEYWNNKFGSAELSPGVPLPGRRQSTPLLMAEYQF